MLAIFKGFIAVIMSVLNLVSWPFFGWFTSGIDSKKSDANMVFAAISDVHLKDNVFREEMLKLGFYDMENSKRRLDACVFCGDNTDHGEREQYDALAKTVGKFDIADNLIFAMGNHDTWTSGADGEHQFTLAKENFIDFNKKAAGRELDNVYYSTEVNGYTFISLSSEYSHTDAYISDAQLQWLDSEMAKAARKNLPIFVICHWPINQTHGLPESWGDKEYEPDTGGLGDQSDEVEKILKSYDNVFFINGHIHSGFVTEKGEKIYNYNTVESDGSFHSVNLPCYMYMTPRGRIANGTGFVVEVYDDEVLFRGRSFSAGLWYTAYEYSVEIQ